MKRILFALILILASCAAFAYVPSEYAALCEIYEIGGWGTPDNEGGTTTHVTVLNLSGSEFEEVPAAIANLPYLKTLSISYTGTKNYPSFLENLNYLEYLDLSGNGLTAIPDFVFSLSSLTNLDLQFNNIETVGAGIGLLTKLEYLNLSWNNIKSLPSGFSNLYKLETLYIGRNDFTAFPEVLCNLGSLKYLDISNNRGITAIPASISFITSLEMLVCWQCGISSVPNSIGQLRSLEGLYLGDNNLSSVPSVIGTMTSLKYLSLDKNNLTSVPSFGSLYKLQELDLSTNHLTTFPESVLTLPNLTNLILDYNDITTLPDGINNMPALTYFGAYFNEITTAPVIDEEKKGTYYRFDLMCNHLPLSELRKSLTESDADYQFPTQRLGANPTNPADGVSGQSIVLRDVVVSVTDPVNWCGFVNSPDNIWGVKVYGIAGHHGNASGKITIKGSLSVEDGELVVYADVYTTSDVSAKAKPRYMANSKLGGTEFGIRPATLGGEGLNTAGLYVRTTGKVLSVYNGEDEYDPSYCVISDSTTADGVKVYFNGTIPAVGKQVSVTGAVSVEESKPAIVANDIAVVK